MTSVEKAKASIVLARKEGKKKNLATLHVSILPENTDLYLHYTTDHIRILGIGLKIACNRG